MGKLNNKVATTTEAHGLIYMMEGFSLIVSNTIKEGEKRNGTASYKVALKKLYKVKKRGHGYEI